MMDFSTARPLFSLNDESSEGNGTSKSVKNGFANVTLFIRAVGSGRSSPDGDPCRMIIT